MNATSIIVGRERADLRSESPSEQRLQGTIRRCGELPDASNTALGEALLLTRHLGLDNKWLMEFLAETSGGPNVLKGRGPAIATALNGGDTGPVTFDIELVIKDLTTILDEAKRRGAPMPLVAKTLEVYEGAIKDGWAAKDASWLPAYWPSKNPKK